MNPRLFACSIIAGLLGVGSCAPLPPDGDDGPDAGPEEVVLPLEEGVYLGTVLGLSDDGCGDLSGNLSAGDWTLSWEDDDSSFTITNANETSVVPCEFADDVITCEPYVQTASPNITTSLEIAFSGGEVAVLSPTSFQLEQTVTFDCSGAGCGDFAASNNVTLPCDVDLEGDYAIAP
jgi:hypothetical protein